MTEVPASLDPSPANAPARGSRTGIDYLRHDALALARLVRSGEVAPLELLEDAVTRAGAQDARFNFLAQRLFDHGRDHIERGLPAGPFTGVPFLVKDLNTDIAGFPTRHGSRLYRDNIAQESSELVRRHEAAGLVIFGKTTTAEFGLSGTTESIANGATRNPWDPGRSAGGSSGGAAAAVAAGVVPMAHASDGGGSIRIPASACGLFGLKPSRGRVPMGPRRTEGWGGLSVHGAISRSVRDSAALLDATHGLEPGSRYTAPACPGGFLDHAGRDPGPLRIALMLTPISNAPVDPEVAESTRQAARLCEALGHRVEEAGFRFDSGRLGEASFALISTALARDLDAYAAQSELAIGPDAVEPITLDFYAVGKQLPGTAVAAAHATLQQLALEVSRFMDRFDIILNPVLAAPPAPLGTHALDHRDLATWGQAIGGYAPFTGPFNATGQPSMSVPLGMSGGGLPIGSMFTGRYGEEATLFQLASQLERAAPWFGQLPPSAHQWGDADDGRPGGA